MSSPLPTQPEEEYGNPELPEDLLEELTAEEIEELNETI